MIARRSLLGGALVVGAATSFVALDAALAGPADPMPLSLPEPSGLQPSAKALRLVRDNLLWDNHSCMPLRPGDVSFLDQLWSGPLGSERGYAADLTMARA
ncbi:hypothetical protein [Sphingosinicella microcystinivorans]|uniref:Uncharacterized protein n=1 Tax=Sphingosinicella microcystinivorans TaxID=335406 RepID=A0AAD1D2Z1_SPHMI|nr:hypothetical protein [Sphingosinicella microcystinivorans]RKS94260.1 hypothetical protein DFR51_0027 [Sphingosinicella microcystinivorans]BBE32373.1 hypothetical protein SmB9_00310 [Sphingosinicella microcystinivorans]